MLPAGAASAMFGRPPYFLDRTNKVLREQEHEST